MDELLSKDKRRLFKALTVLMVIVSLLFVVLIILAIQWTKIAQSVEQSTNTITISGKSERYVAPDIATVTLRIEEKGKTVSSAQEKATKKTNAVVKFLKKEDVKEKDIKTTNYNIRPEYRYFYEHDGMICAKSYCPPPYIQNKETVGYTVSQSVQIKIRDIDDAGEIVAGLGKIEVTNISSLSFAVEDYDDVKEEVYNEAIKDAREKAKQRAKSLGVRLGKIVRVSDSGGIAPYPMYARADMAMVGGKGGAIDEEVAPEIPAGENHIVSTVSIVYEVK